MPDICRKCTSDKHLNSSLAAMHLARNVPKRVFSGKEGGLVELYSTPKALQFIARNLDDAGVREAVEKLEARIKVYDEQIRVGCCLTPVDDRLTIKYALAALNGTTPEVDDGTS